MNTHLIAVVVSALVAAGGVWQWSSSHYNYKIAQLERDYAQSALKEIEKANAETIRLQQQADSAAKKAAAKTATLNRDLAAASDALGRLSHAADSALRDAQASHDQCLARAAALADVFGRCSREYGFVAKEADRLGIDKQALIESCTENTPQTEYRSAD